MKRHRKDFLNIGKEGIHKQKEGYLYDKKDVYNYTKVSHYIYDNLLGKDINKAKDHIFI